MKAWPKSPSRATTMRSGGPARRYYRRTSFGRAVARAESERLRALLDVARAQKILGGPK